MKKNKIGVNYFGPASIASGLGTASRGYLRSLRSVDFNVTVYDTGRIFYHQDQVNYNCETSKCFYPVSIAHINADATERFLHFFGDIFQRSKYKIGIWVWELSSFRHEWFKFIHVYDEIWVPSHFCKRSIGAMSSKPVLVMPHIVEPVASSNGDSNKEVCLVKDNCFNFLYIFDVTSYLKRKNPELLIDAFIEEFHNDANVNLILKASYSSQNKDEWQKIKKKIDSHKNIFVIDKVLPIEEVYEIIKTSDCYVSPNRGEGFGLTVAEAMYFSKPVIATDYGGTADFLTHNNGYPLEYRMEEINEDVGPYPKSFIWANPSKKDLKKKMRCVYSNTYEAKIKARRGEIHIKKEYSSNAVGRKIFDRLNYVYSQM